MSLHWILALTLTLLHCITAKPIDPLREVPTHIDRMKNMTCLEPDSTFYTPIGGENCTIKALDCSVLELNKFLSECVSSTDQTFKQMTYRAMDLIEEVLMVKNFKLEKDPNNCFCGNVRAEEKPHNEFLENIKTLFQKLNSSLSPKEA